MVFITTFTEEIYNICGRNLLKSFIETKNSEIHQLYVFFENESDLHTEFYPEWLIEWANEPSILIINLMNYEYGKKKIIPYVDEILGPKISFTDEYSSPRSVKWFRPVAAMQYASEILGTKNFSSIDSDCLFINKVEESFFDSILSKYNIAFLGRENFKLMRHGGYASDGSYIHTNTVEATKKDIHTETGYLGFNMDKEGTVEFIKRNFEYWVNQDILNLEFKTDCHTFDATRKELPLNYNNLCEHMGELSPIGSRVIEASSLGSFMIHHKGTIGPILYQKNLLK
jgi:hypothetical protein